MEKHILECAVAVGPIGKLGGGGGGGGMYVAEQLGKLVQLKTALVLYIQRPPLFSTVVLVS